MNWLATIRSISLAKKLKLEIGRKELRSLESSDGFFNRAETRVCLSESGSRPDFREALQAAAIIGESTAAGFFTSHVGLDQEDNVY